ncbi:MAG TPA: Hsp20/alpha crystallin family protein [Planctomycetota bacterium]|jgi:HSP20 family protein|nr:Hsp20/alpha crystallin family protein [Planctomycetota bacterium]
MSLIRWDPFRELEDVNERLNRMFGRPIPHREGAKETLAIPDWTPTLDIVETPEEYTIQVELPGIPKESVKIAVEERLLRIEGERRQDREEKGKKFHRMERAYGSFLRTFALPDNVDETQVRADFKDGILTVRLPKTQKAKPKTVEVKVT